MTDAGNQIEPMVQTFAAGDMDLSGQISLVNDTLQGFHKMIAAIQESIKLGLRQVKDEVKNVDEGLRQVKDEVKKVDEGLRQEIAQMKEELVKSIGDTLNVVADTTLDLEEKLTRRIVRLEEHVGLSNEADGLNAEIGNSSRND